jgi:hypothetical protein
VPRRRRRAAAPRTMPPSRWALVVESRHHLAKSTREVQATRPLTRRGARVTGNARRWGSPWRRPKPSRRGIDDSYGNGAGRSRF